jgi:hypothetical protein
MRHFHQRPLEPAERHLQIRRHGLLAKVKPKIALPRHPRRQAADGAANLRVTADSATKCVVVAVAHGIDDKARWIWRHGKFVSDATRIELGRFMTRNSHHRQGDVSKS